ncbi:MAG: aminoglycoside phosphotransferase family protein [Clostridia bacterium]|nr:aminoglycoside phosphotransferase family protein [Clostridia bacterium]
MSIDSNRIKNYLDDQFPYKHILEVFDLKQLSSGWAGDVYSFSVALDTQTETANESYIIKTYSESDSGVKSIIKEYKALDFLYSSGYPVPKPIIHNTDTVFFGKPFIIMEQIKGMLLFESYTNSPLDKKASVLRTFAHLLFHLHSIDAKGIEPGFSSRGQALLDTEIGEIKALIDLYQIDSLRRIYEWIINNKKTVSGIKPSILHRDYHPWNVIEDTAGHHFVIDWIWSIGDFRFDLAWTVTLMERAGFESFAKGFLEEYELMCGSRIDNLEYFKVMAALRWLLNVTVSVKTGDNLRGGDSKAFKEFLEPLVNKALTMFQAITGILIEYSL